MAVKSKVCRFVLLFFRSSQPINLEVGGKYYLELVGREITRDDHFRVAVQFPDGTEVNPLTYEFLEPYH